MKAAEKIKLQAGVSNKLVEEIGKAYEEIEKLKAQIVVLEKQREMLLAHMTADIYNGATNGNES